MTATVFNTIFKYELPVVDQFTIEMPRGARVLSVQLQYGKPVIWALVDPGVTQEPRHFVLVGTGHAIDPTGLRFIGTFQLAGGQLVLHLWERES